MHEVDDFEKDLKIEAQRLSDRFSGAPVIIIVEGDEKAGIDRTMTASAFRPGENRLRDLLGILQTSIQIETLKHFKFWG